MPNELMICICGRGYTTGEEFDRCPKCGRSGHEKCLELKPAGPIDDETLWGEPVEKLEMNKEELEYASAAGSF
jgi:hypothetical protein